MSTRRNSRRRGLGGGGGGGDRGRVEDAGRGGGGGVLIVELPGVDDGTATVGIAVPLLGDGALGGSPVPVGGVANS